MPIASPELNLDSIEKLREEELDEAISHEFQPAALVGGDCLVLAPRRHDWHIRRRRFRQGPAGGHVCGAGGTLRGHPQNRTASDPSDGSLEQETVAPRDTLQIYRYPVRPARPHHSAVASFKGLGTPCRKIPAGIAGPHLLNHPEIYGRLPAIGRYDRRDFALFGKWAQRVRQSANRSPGVRVGGPARWPAFPRLQRFVPTCHLT
jgi:hypothetical protein